MKLFARIYRAEPERIEEALAMVGLIKEKKTAAGNLSKGMRSRLMLARAFLNRPKILFLDEPTSGLDPVTTGEIHALINRAKENGTTVFLTTHNMEEAAKLCDHVALLNDGKIVEYGVPEEICRKYNEGQRFLLHLKDGSNVSLRNDKETGAVLCKYIEDGQVESIHSTEPSLETVFIRLTGRKLTN